MRMPIAPAALILLLAGCSSQTTTDTTSVAAGNRVETITETETPANDTPAPSTSAAPFDAAAYLGHWVGVEGMVLDVSRGQRPGTFTLAMQWSLDDRGVFTGTAQSDPSAPGIAFTRNGERLLLRRGDGDATGLKWLAGRKECLIVKTGEGYCRR